MGEWLSQKKVASWLGLTPRQVYNLAEARIIDAKVEGGRTSYEWPESLRRYVDWKVAEAEKRARPNDVEDRRARKIAAEAELLELDLAKVRGELVPVTAVREQMRTIASTIRAQLMAIPGRYSPRTVGIASLPESQRVWDAAMRDILTELRDGGGV